MRSVNPKRQNKYRMLSEAHILALSNFKHVLMYLHVGDLKSL